MQNVCLEYSIGPPMSERILFRRKVLPLRAARTKVGDSESKGYWTLFGRIKNNAPYYFEIDDIEFWMVKTDGGTGQIVTQDGKPGGGEYMYMESDDHVFIQDVIYLLPKEDWES